MFDSKVGTAIPMELVRFGKAYHGLMNTHATPSLGSEQIDINYADFRLLTRGGKSIAPPLSRLESKPTPIYGQRAGFGRALLYKHPLAVMDEEAADGKDFSGYVVFFIDYQNNWIASYYGFGFAFTPDDNSQGLLIDQSFRNIYAPKIIGEYYTESVKINWPEGVQVDKVFHVSPDGRQYYFGNFATPANVAMQFNFSQPQMGGLKIAKVSMSGGVVDGLPSISCSVDYITDLPPTMEWSSRPRVEKRRTANFYLLEVGKCVPEGSNSFVEFIEDGEYSPGIKYMTSLDYYTQARYVGKIGASVVSGVVQYLELDISLSDEEQGSGTYNAEASSTLGTEPCGSEEGYVNVLTTTASFSAASAQWRQVLYRAELKGYGGSSVVEYEQRRTESRTSSQTSGSTGEMTSSSNVTATVRFMGQTLLSISGEFSLAFGDISGSLVASQRFIIPEKPIMNGFLQGSVYSRPDSRVHKAVILRQISGSNNEEWAQITIDVFNYGSADMQALSVTVEQGLLVDIPGDGYYIGQVFPDTYTATMYIGPIFCNGKVYDLPHTQSLTEHIGGSLSLYRAYDPLTDTISAIHDAPVFYL